MDFLKKNKIIVGVIVVIAVALIGAFFFLSGSKSQSPQATTGDQTENVKKISPEDIGLSFSLKDDKKAVILKITKLNGIKSFEYELDYNAIVTEEGETNEVPRGVLSTIDVTSGDSELNKEILLGTCSSGTCKYDKVTSDIKLVLKVNYSNGEVGSLEASIPFNTSDDQ